LNIRTIIFSKDRPLQLHGTLESFRLHCAEATDTPISVVYHTSGSDSERGYEKLKSISAEEGNIEWIKEENFKRDLLSQLEQRQEGGIFRRFWNGKTVLKADHVLFLVDDNLFVDSFSLQNIVDRLEEMPKALGFSLRVGKNTRYCYSNQCDQSFPDSSERDDGVLEFSWVGQQGDFGYPIEVSSSVYRTADLIRLLRRLPYTNPNRLEQGLSASRMLFVRSHPKLLCFNKSVAFCAPLNKVQSVLDNRAGSSETYSSAALLLLWLDGHRIDVSRLTGFVPESAHQEIELPLLRVSP